MNRSFAVALFALLLPFPIANADESPVRSPWNVTQKGTPESFIIQSHRGAGELSSDNTVQAFELGWKMGTYPESDVRTTSDGIIVAFHDKDFRRVVKDIDPAQAGLGVKDLTYSELEKFDIGSWKGPDHANERIPRLRDVFALMKGKPERHLYLDIKEVDLTKLAAEVSEAGVGAQVVLATSKHEIIIGWKKLVPDSDTLLWIPGTEKAKRERLEKVREKNFEGITQIQIHVDLPADAKDLQPGEPFSPSRKFLIGVSQELAARGILFQTLPWKANSGETYRQLLDAGCASFASDHPDVTRALVADYFKEASGKK
jgi:glycerophosphoryl diester phosphodiesterase